MKIKNDWQGGEFLDCVKHFLLFGLVEDYMSWVIT